MGLKLKTFGRVGLAVPCQREKVVPRWGVGLCLNFRVLSFLWALDMVSEGGDGGVLS
jgi:hypothetical protein